jgi:hypothetical protein
MLSALGSSGPVILPSICDGFTYNPQLRANTENYDILGTGQLELLRRSRGFIPRLFAVPDFSDGIVQNYQTIQRQIQVSPGSWLWAVTTTSGPTPINDNLYFVTIRDDDTGDSLFNMQFTASQTLRPESTAQASPLSYAYSVQKKLTQPRVISGKGILDVQISCTVVSSPKFFQVVLCVAQPCSEVLNQDADLCAIYDSQQ